nr:acetate--CoA ligase family protein [Acidimicrobiia bacterium]
ALAAAGLDPAPVRDVLMRTAQLAADHPAVVRLELNPLIVSEASAFVTDVEVHVAPVRHVPGPLRRLE